MSDKIEKTTKAYKVSTDTREKLEELFQDSGFETEGGFIEHVAAVYEMQQLKNGDAGYQKHIAALEYHTRSTVDLFMGMLQTESAERREMVEGFERKLYDRGNEIFTLQEEILSLKSQMEALAEQKNKIAEENGELRKDIGNLEQINKRDEELLSEYKERNERLSKLITENTEEVNAAKQLRQQVSELIKEKDATDRELANLKGDFQSLQEIKDELLRKLREDHERELQREQERAELAQERAVLAVRTELQDRQDKERTSYNESLRKLYDELDRMRQQLNNALQANKTQNEQQKE
ncbi:hypothetical protein [Paenibacillus abyssi]|uniref:Uncharacterized protein n=1 Tax=Paenibacillus abyssi TaxID=1340531 RepID=A0A917G1T6_9BACL|nr:hypothetical protein [Paenibacillus abyssi]GGG18252.1 hypothetical protein GCM10010916_38850 [Paenibacillus abyssi]